MVHTFIKIIVDITCVLLVGLIVVILSLVSKPFERGFFCDDESLKYPYKDDTVPAWTLNLVLIIPTIIIILTEYALSNKLSKPNPNKKITKWVQDAFVQVGTFVFGAGITQVLADTAKYSVGRLRPHFFDVCNPDIDCSDPLNWYKYITTYTCRALDKDKIKSMRLSFPSAHASVFMYTMMFFSLYIHSRFTWNGSMFLKHLMQLLAMALAVFVALSRISDNKHHWSDVLGGTILGIAVAILTALCISKLFPKMRNEYSAFSLTEDNGILPTTVESNL